MTPWKRHTVRFRGNDFDLVQASASGFFIPYEHEISVRPSSRLGSAGFHCVYQVDGVRFVLDALTVASDDPPPLNGVFPIKMDVPGRYRYDSLALPLPITGSLCIGAELLPDRPYPHMWNPQPWAYAEVWELALANGLMVDAQDKSLEMVSEREDMRKRRDLPRATYEVDGAQFSTVDELAAQLSRVLFKGHQWRWNLDSFNDMLHGGFGTPDEGFILRWRNIRLSRERLGNELVKTILEVIQDHGPGGREEEDEIRLELVD